jgi:hypothetical protein
MIKDQQRAQEAAAAQAENDRRFNCGLAGFGAAFAAPGTQGAYFQSAHC